MIKRLRRKFVFINMTIVTVMLVVIFSLIFFFMGVTMEMENRQLMEQAGDGSGRHGNRPADIPADRPERPREPWNSTLVVRVDPQGALQIVGSGRFADVEAEEAGQLVEKVRGKENNYGLLYNEALRYRSREGSGGQIYVFLDVSAGLDTMENLMRTCAVIGLLCFCAFWGISILLARWAIRPVEKAWNQQRRFVADASHELKTPLTVIMTNAELLQSPEYSQEDRSRFTDSILTMSHQMRGLVESLLNLARVDNGTVKMVFSLLDLSELVSDCLLPFEPVFFEKGLLLESRITDGLYTKGSEAHLRQVMEILLDNAAKYAAPEGTVTVTLKRQGNHCLLAVANPGEPIGREELERIFERFYRIDKARAMNHSYGLGLSIAESIVQEHGGKIWADSAEGINTFYVQLTAL